MFLDDAVTLLSSSRYRMGSEHLIQHDIAALLTSNGIKFEKEYSLAQFGRIDFMLEDGIGVEVKLKWSRMRTYGQLVRYADALDVNALILMTATATGLPEIVGKRAIPLRLISLGRAWL